MGFDITAVETAIGRDLKRYLSTPPSEALSRSRDFPDASRIICRMAILEGAFAQAARGIAEPAGTHLIPKKIVQFWDKDEVPSDVQHMMNGWQELTGYQYERFSDKTARQFLVENYPPAIVECYDHSHHPAMKSDIFRVAYLAKCGGVWVDADDSTTGIPPHADFSTTAECVVYPIVWDAVALNFVRMTDNRSRLALGAIKDDNTIAYYLNNSPLACAPGSGFMEELLTAIQTNVLKAKGEGRRSDIHAETGPGTITACFVLHVLRNGFGEGTGFEMSSLYDFVSDRNWCGYKAGDGHWSNVTPEEPKGKEVENAVQTRADSQPDLTDYDRFEETRSALLQQLPSVKASAEKLAETDPNLAGGMMQSAYLRATKMNPFRRRP